MPYDSWLGHLTRKIVPNMTYNVFGGTLNLLSTTRHTEIGNQPRWVTSHPGQLSQAVPL